MDKDTAKRWFLDEALSYRHAWYTWGGDDPAGIDCSGLVVACLKAIGYLPKGIDLTANDLWHRYRHAEVKGSTAGCLAFWFTPDGRAYHVAICLDPWICLTADGGGSQVKTINDAIKYNAFMKIRPTDHRSTKPIFVRIF